jgi:hypothetical protein
LRCEHGRQIQNEPNGQTKKNQQKEKIRRRNEKKGKKSSKWILISFPLLFFVSATKKLRKD